MTKRKFAALADLKQMQETAAPPPDMEEPPLFEPLASAIRGRGRPNGKRSNPEYKPITVLIRPKTQRTANRLLEDLEIQQDFSELVEQLVKEWIDKNKS